MKVSFLSLAGLIFSLLLSSSVAQAQSAEMKIGHVNTGILFESLPGAAIADSLLQLYQDSLRNGLGALEQRYAEKLNYAQTNAQNLTPKQAQQIEVELKELEREAQVYQQEASRNFEVRRGQYLTPLADKVKSSVDEYAKANGYSLILDSSLPNTLLFAEEAKDLTAEVLQLLLAKP